MKERNRTDVKEIQITKIKNKFMKGSYREKKKFVKIWNCTRWTKSGIIKLISEIFSEVGSWSLADFFFFCLKIFLSTDKCVYQNIK